jgi:hypothetical protein
METEEARGPKSLKQQKKKNHAFYKLLLHNMYCFKEESLTFWTQH